VRVGIHSGEPRSEPDPITGRMDYFGPVGLCRYVHLYLYLSMTRRARNSSSEPNCGNEHDRLSNLSRQ